MLSHPIYLSAGILKGTSKSAVYEDKVSTRRYFHLASNENHTVPLASPASDLIAEILSGRKC